MCFSPSLTSSTSMEFPRWWVCSPRRWTGELWLLFSWFINVKEARNTFWSKTWLNPPQYPGVGGLCLLHGRHRESVHGSIQRAEDSRLCVDSVSRGEAAQTSVRINLQAFRVKRVKQDRNIRWEVNWEIQTFHWAGQAWQLFTTCYFQPLSEPSLSRLSPMESNRIH